MAAPTFATMFAVLVNSGAISELTPAGAKVLLVLVALFDWMNLTCYPGSERLQELTGMTKQGVINGVKNLTDLGVISVKKGGGRKNKSVYTLLAKQENGQASLTVSEDTNGLPPLTVSTEKGQPQLQKGSTAVAPIRKNSSEHIRGDRVSPASLFDAAPAENRPLAVGTHNLVALWAEGYQRVLGRPMPDSCRGKVVGIFKSLLSSFEPQVLEAAIERWFAVTQRADYAIGFFKARLEGGNRELLGASNQAVQDTQAIRNGQILEEMLDASD